jgi:hypothetical protein
MTVEISDYTQVPRPREDERLTGQSSVAKDKESYASVAE